MTISCPPSCIKGTPLWSLYDITDNNPEFCLYDSVVSEYTDIAGWPVLYYRAKTKMDRLYGEDSNQDYYDPVETKLYYEPSNEPNMIDMFGVRSDETLEYSLIPKSNFTRDVGGSVDGVPLTIDSAVGGSGYVPSESVLTTGGSGEGLRVDIVTTNGIVTNIKINDFNKGFGYLIGDIITIEGGDQNSTFRIATTGSEDIGPMAGDVIKTLWNNRNYEIVDIGAEQSIFMGRKLVWEFILRPYRFSEQSLFAEQIHRSRVLEKLIYIYPDGEFADVTYSDGTSVQMIPVDTLSLDLGGLECGYRYNVNEDGSVEMIENEVVVDPLGDEDDYLDTETVLKDKNSKTYGDDAWIEVESDKIDDYGDVDSKIFGF